MADIGHARSRGLLLDNLAGGTLGAHKEDFVLVGCEAFHKFQRFIEGRYRLLEINNVNLVAGTKYVLVHLGIPVTGLVTKVRARLQQVTHAYLHV